MSLPVAKGEDGTRRAKLKVMAHQSIITCSAVVYTYFDWFSSTVRLNLLPYPENPWSHPYVSKKIPVTRTESMKNRLAFRNQEWTVLSLTGTAALRWEKPCVFRASRKSTKAFFFLSLAVLEVIARNSEALWTAISESSSNAPAATPNNETSYCFL